MLCNCLLKVIAYQQTLFSLNNCTLALSGGSLFIEKQFDRRKQLLLIFTDFVTFVRFVISS